VVRVENFGNAICALSGRVVVWPAAEQDDVGVAVNDARDSHATPAVQEVKVVEGRFRAKRTLWQRDKLAPSKITKELLWPPCQCLNGAWMTR
jgi:hypothetical protein